MSFRVNHAAMINMLTNELLSGLGTKPVRLSKNVLYTVKFIVMLVRLHNNLGNTIYSRLELPAADRENGPAHIPGRNQA